MCNKLTIMDNKSVLIHSYTCFGEIKEKLELIKRESIQLSKPFIATDLVTYLFYIAYSV